MLNKLAKLALVSTALAPICLTLWFVEISSVWQDGKPWADNFCCPLACGRWLSVGGADAERTLFWFGTAVGLAPRVWKVCQLKSKLLKPWTRKSSAFLLIYLLPLINQSHNAINLPVLVFVAVIFFFIVYNSHAYHFNPLLGMFGYS